MANGQPRAAPAPLDRAGSAHLALAVALVLFPLVASDFFLTQIGAYSLIFGMIALSLMVLAGYGGMVSLAQVTIAVSHGCHRIGWKGLSKVTFEQRLL
jgi:hypothetical protein